LSGNPVEASRAAQAGRALAAMGSWKVTIRVIT
jgi:hypothetical protein